MNKILTLSCCLLGLAVACVPAYANPFNKKITLSCDVTAGTDVITGDVTTMTLCAPSTPACTAETVDCYPRYPRQFLVIAVELYQ
jgi:hypothetical protein